MDSAIQLLNNWGPAFIFVFNLLEKFVSVYLYVFFFSFCVIICFYLLVNNYNNCSASVDLGDVICCS